MNDVENALRETLGHAAERAPHAPPTLAVHLERRHRRRRHRAQALTAAVAVIAVAAGVTFLPHAKEQGPASATVSATPGVTQPPIEEVWPEAIRKIPANLPDGLRFRPLLFLDDHSLLVKTEVDFEQAGAIHAYDLDTGEVRKIADLPQPEDTVLFPADFTFGDGQIVWWTANEDRNAQLWSVPLTGGEPTMVASQEAGKRTEEPDNDAALDRLSVRNGTITFSFRSGGVFRVPLAGGTVEPVQGADNLHVLAGPWIGSVGRYGKQEETRFGEIINLETGERNTAVVAPGESDVSCDETYCSGTRGDAGFVRLRDGSQERPIPAPGWSPVNGRFLLDLGTDQVLMLDLVTGKAADLRIKREARGVITVPLNAAEGRLYAYQVDEQLVVIDYSKIK